MTYSETSETYKAGLKPLNCLDIVISIFNQENLIDKVLHGVFKNTTTPFNLILVFDGCTDNTKNVALSVINGKKPALLRDLRITDAPNVYETKANNIGFRMSSEPYLITLQDDMVILEKGWERRLTYPLRAFNDIFAVTARTALNIHFNPNDPLPIYSDKAARENFTLGRDSFEIRPVINRGPIALRTDVLKKLGYLDEAFAPAQLDEADLVIRAAERFGMKSGAFWTIYRSDESWGKTRTAGTSMNTKLTLLKNARLLLTKHPALALRNDASSKRKIIIRDSDIDYNCRSPLLKRIGISVSRDLYFIRWNISRKIIGFKVRLRSMRGLFR